MGKITVDQYIVGVLGLSVIRNWYQDGDFNQDRLNDLRTVLDQSDDFPWNIELNPQEKTLTEGYAQWAETYDGPNPLIESEERVVQPLLQRLAQPGAHALDAACGTGRHAKYLDSLGCRCVGVDQSAEMLDIARAKLPDGRFEQGSLEQLPFEDDKFDFAIVSLALCHLNDPTSALSELARVVQPGGTVIVTDPHPAAEMVGGQAFYGGIAEGQPMRWVRNHYHPASTWLKAFWVTQLTVADCIEQPFSDEQIAGFPASMFFPEAAMAAASGLPSLWMWELTVAQ